MKFKDLTPEQQELYYRYLDAKNQGPLETFGRSFRGNLGGGLSGLAGSIIALKGANMTPWGAALTKNPWGLAVTSGVGGLTGAFTAGPTAQRAVEGVLPDEYFGTPEEAQFQLDIGSRLNPKSAYFGRLLPTLLGNKLNLLQLGKTVSNAPRLMSGAAELTVPQAQALASIPMGAVQGAVIDVAGQTVQNQLHGVPIDLSTLPLSAAEGALFTPRKWFNRVAGLPHVDPKAYDVYANTEQRIFDPVTGKLYTEDQFRGGMSEKQLNKLVEGELQTEPVELPDLMGQRVEITQATKKKGDITPSSYDFEKGVYTPAQPEVIRNRDGSIKLSKKIVGEPVTSSPETFAPKDAAAFLSKTEAEAQNIKLQKQNEARKAQILQEAKKVTEQSVLENRIDESLADGVDRAEAFRLAQAEQVSQQFAEARAQQELAQGVKDALEGAPARSLQDKLPPNPTKFKRQLKQAEEGMTPEETLQENLARQDIKEQTAYSSLDQVPDSELIKLQLTADNAGDKIMGRKIARILETRRLARKKPTPEPQLSSADYNLGRQLAAQMGVEVGKTRGPLHKTSESGGGLARGVSMPGSTDRIAGVSQTHGRADTPTHEAWHYTIEDLVRSKNPAHHELVRRGIELYGSEEAFVDSLGKGQIALAKRIQSKPSLAKRFKEWVNDVQAAWEVKNGKATQENIVRYLNNRVQYGRPYAHDPQLNPTLSGRVTPSMGGKAYQDTLHEWVREAMISKGLDPARVFNYIVLTDTKNQEAIRNDPTLTEEQKASLSSTGSLKKYQDVDADLFKHPGFYAINYETGEIKYSPNLGGLFNKVLNPNDYQIVAKPHNSAAMFDVPQDIISEAFSPIDTGSTKIKEYEKSLNLFGKTPTQEDAYSKAPTVIDDGKVFNQTGFKVKTPKGDYESNDLVELKGLADTLNFKPNELVYYLKTKGSSKWEKVHTLEQQASKKPMEVKWVKDLNPFEIKQQENLQTAKQHFYIPEEDVSDLPRAINNEIFTNLPLAKKFNERYGHESQMTDFQLAQVQTNPFKNWFGLWDSPEPQLRHQASRVVNSYGYPLIVYHGSKAPFGDVFFPEKMQEGQAHFGTLAQASDFVYKGEEPNESQVSMFRFNNRGDNIKPVFLNIRNPFVIKDTFSVTPNYTIDEIIRSFQRDPTLIQNKDAWYDLRDKAHNGTRSKEYWDEVRQLLKAEGYDGFKYINTSEGAVGKPHNVAWVPFEKTQIKSAISNSGEFNPNDPRISYQAVPFGIDPEVVAKAEAEGPTGATSVGTGIHFVRSAADAESIVKGGFKPGIGMGDYVSFYHEGQRPSDFGVGRKHAVIITFDKAKGGNPKYEGGIRRGDIASVRQATEEEISQWGKKKGEFNPQDPRISYQDVPYGQEQGRTSINLDDYDLPKPTKGEREGRQYTPLEEKYKNFTPKGIAKLLASSIDRVRFTGTTPETREVSNYAADAFEEADVIKRALTGKFNEDIMRQIASLHLNHQEATDLRKWAWEMNELGESEIRLNPKQQQAFQIFDKVLKDALDFKNQQGLMTYDGHKYRPAQKKPYYFPAIVDNNVKNIVLSNKGTAKAQAYIQELVDFWAQKTGNYNQALEDAHDYIRGLGQWHRPEESSSKFNALRKAEGLGLPYSWVDKNLFTSLSRYFNRYATDLSFFMAVENDPVMRGILNIKDQFGSVEKNAKLMPSGLPIYDNNPVETHPATGKVLTQYLVPPSNLDATVQALNRFVVSGVLGPASGLRDMASSFYHDVYWSKITDVPKLLSTIKDFKQNWKESFKQGVNRTRITALEYGNMAASDPELRAYGRVVDALQYGADFLQKYQGRQLLEQTNRAIQFGLGRELAWRSLMNDSPIDKRFRMRFGGEEWAGNRNVPDEVINEMAAKFVEGNQGTYSPRGLPNFTQRGLMAPFLSLNRWNFEKFNTMYKDVYLPLRLEGDFKPLLKATLGAVVGGEIINELSEFLNNKLKGTPSLKEAFSEGNTKDKLATLGAFMNYAGYFGVMSQLLGTAASQYYNQSAQSIANFPFFDIAYNAIHGNTMEYVRAMQQPDIDKWEATRSWLHNMMTDMVQLYRIIGNWTVEEEDNRRRDMERNVRVFETLNDPQNRWKASLIKQQPVQLENVASRKFNRAQSVEEAMPYLEGGIARAARAGDPAKFADLTGQMAANSEKILPSKINTVTGFKNLYAYRDFFLRTGKGTPEDWNALVTRYLNNAQNARMKQHLIDLYIQQNPEKIGAQLNEGQQRKMRQ